MAHTVIGVLALQGDFKEHLDVLSKLNTSGIEVRTVNDLQKTSCLIIPGGESTTIGKLLVSTGLDRAIIKRAKQGYPIYGTCAGAILLSKLKLINLTVERNAYGRQIDSFDERIESKQFLNLRGVFIRAPRFIKVGKQVEVLARYHAEPVLVQHGNILAGAFHPELTNDLSVHRYFVNLVTKRNS